MLYSSNHKTQLYTATKSRNNSKLIMAANTLKIVPKPRVFSETGSAFDTTNIEKQVKVCFSFFLFGGHFHSIPIWHASYYLILIVITFFFF